MPRKFIIDYGEEEDIPEPGIHGLPRYLIPWDSPREPTDQAMQYYNGTRRPQERELWLVKYIRERAGTRATKWAIGTNNIGVTKGWYWEDTVQMTNAHGFRPFAILKVLDILPAPWW